MKTKIAALCFLLILSIRMSAQLNNADIALTDLPEMMLHTVVSANEEDLIKKAIIAETDHYFARDMNRWKNCFVNSEKTAIIQKYSDGELLSVRGLDVIAAKAKKAWKENPDMDFKTTDRLQWNISIKDNVAWVHYKQKAMVNGTEYSSEEIRVLVKEAGNWKIALESSIF